MRAARHGRGPRDLRDGLFASHLFERPTASTSRPCVRRAEEFIAAHTAEELTVARIAEAAGVPVRSLQIAFRTAMA
ncbi:hypothetical protein [Sorangium sp. So ce1097]|uniref:hypothetical protein n=1 Tax=Sorangium sp. So ce1097 TaxID=3133330 RepID=UPI003F63642B